MNRIPVLVAAFDDTGVYGLARTPWAAVYDAQLSAGDLNRTGFSTAAVTPEAARFACCAEWTRDGRVPREAFVLSYGVLSLNPDYVPPPDDDDDD